MTTAYTSLLGLALPVTGELSGTWGDTVNDAITSLLDSAVAGTTTITVDADTVLTSTTGAANQARQAIIRWAPATGTTTRNITAPATSKAYIVINASGGTQSIVLRGTGPTTGVTIVKGETALCAWSGTDFVKISNTSGAGAFTTLSASSTVTFTGLNASQAVFTNGSDQLVSNAITGTGNVVMSTSPTLVTPVLGTPSSGTLTSCTGLPISTGVSGLGTGIATFLATPSSANLATAVTDETGSGALVFGTSPSLTTPALAGETFSTAAAVTAGTNAQGQGALTNDYNVITTAASAPSGVTLPTATTGRRIVIVNKGANIVNVYPATGGSIDAIAINTSIALAVGGVMEFNASSATQWYSSYNLYTSATVSSGVTSFNAGTTGLTPSTATTGAITLAGTLGLANGGTAATSANAALNNLMGYTTTATAAGTTTLTATSSYKQYFTGTTTQTVVMPDVTTLALGRSYELINNSTGLVTVNSSGANLITTIPAGISGVITCIAITGTSAASWHYEYASFDTITGTGANVFATSPTLVTPALGTPSSATLTNATGLPLTTGVTGVLPIANGGTNSTATATAGGVGYGTGTAHAYTAAGTAGQAIVSNGTSAPTWQELTLANLPGAWVKKAVDCATTAALTLNTAQTTIDGVTLSASSRVLVKDQATASQNGIYTNVTTVSWTRTTDADAAAELAGATVAVDAGTVNGGSVWTTGFKSTDTLGTTAMNWYVVFDGSTVVPATNGGTGQSSYAVGDLVYASTTTALSKLADVATGNALISGGVGVAPSYGKIGLTTHVSGTLPLANGGTNATTAPAALANLMGFTTTATAAGTTTLTNTSSSYQIFTGSTTQTVVLPVVTTLVQGWTFHIVNNSTGVVTVNSSGGNLVISVPAGVTTMCTCILITGTTAASWEAGLTDFSTVTGTGSVVLSASPTFTSVPAAPTAAEKTATTQLATCAFVDRLRSLTTPSTAASGTVTAVVGDRGALLAQTSGSVTIPNAVFAARDVLTIYNNSASDITITQGASFTLRLVGTATTGNRTLAQRGLATVVFISASEAVISGGGLT